MRISALKRSNVNMSLSRRNAVGIKITDLLSNQILLFHAVRAAARALNVDRRLIEHHLYINQSKPLLGIYAIELQDVSKNMSSDVHVQVNSKRLELTNVHTNEVRVYPSVSKAARELKLYQASISLYLKENRSNPFKGIYKFRYI